MALTKTSELQTEVQNLALKVSDFLLFFEQQSDFEFQVYQYWDAKVVLGHIVFWHESFAKNVCDLANNRKPHPLRGKLSDVNSQSVQSTRMASVQNLSNRLQHAQKTIEEHILSESITLIPYKIGSRPYPPLEHVKVVTNHINIHLRDLIKTYKNG